MNPNIKPNTNPNTNPETIQATHPAAGHTINQASNRTANDSPEQEPIQCSTHRASSSSGGREINTQTFIILLAALTLMGFVLRLWFWRLSVGGDEAYTFLSYTRGSFLTALGKYNLPNNHILNSIFIHFSRKFSGDSILALRLPVFVFGLATIFALGIVGRKITNSWVIGLAAAAFTAFSARMIHVSVEARGYGLQTFFFLCSVAAAERVLTTKSRPWVLTFAATSALGLLSVPTHLYSIASIGLWMILQVLFEKSGEYSEIRESGEYRDSAEFSEVRESGKFGEMKTAIATIVRSHFSLASFAITLYAPVLFYVAANGTKIESAEPLNHLPASIKLRIGELISLWSAEHSLFTSLWLASGSILLLVFARRAHGLRQALLLISLILGPIIIFIATKRVAPFARVWTYSLPVIFLLAAYGWCLASVRLFNRERIRNFILPLIIALPLLTTTIYGFKFLAIELKSSGPASAERAFDKVVRSLQPGDHLAFDSEFYQQVRFIALTKKEVPFVPLMRQSDGELAVIEQDGREVLKANPFDRTKPGRTFLYALNSAQKSAMEKWLTPFLPAGLKLVSKIVNQAEGFSSQGTKTDGADEIYPILYEFDAVSENTGK